MQNQYDLKRYAVLYVDDEEKALKYFEKTFGDEFRIFTANNAADGLKLIEQHGEDIGVLREIGKLVDGMERRQGDGDAPGVDDREERLDPRDAWRD